MNTTKIDITKLLKYPDEELRASGEATLEPTELGGETIEFPTPFTFDVRLHHAGEGIVVAGEASGSVRLRCGRCLEPLMYETTVTFKELAVAESEDGEDPDEAFKLADKKLDVAPIIYQNVIVEVPIRPLCREECAGLCGQCGKDLNKEPHIHKQDQIDERLAPLKDFFNKEREK